jgi:alkanesulfonate monooxygenase SsuD/methylene tetrahydromethanopterin reductase-like flavin-dependent oxidoreductase (luciferase family)
LAKVLFWLRSFNPDWADIPITSIFETLRSRIKSLTWGTPEEVVQQFHQYAEAGVEEFIIQWGAFDDLDGLKLLAEQVLPHMTALSQKRKPSSMLFQSNVA